jgi:hypothetical protein
MIGCVDVPIASTDLGPFAMAVPSSVVTKLRRAIATMLDAQGLKDIFSNDGDLPGRAHLFDMVERTALEKSRAQTNGWATAGRMTVVFKTQRRKALIKRGCVQRHRKHRGSTRSLDSLVLNTERAVCTLHLPFRQRASSEQTGEVKGDDNDEEKPRYSLETPPATLKLEVFANGHLTVDLGYGVTDRSYF